MLYLVCRNRDPYISFSDRSLALFQSGRRVRVTNKDVDCFFKEVEDLLEKKFLLEIAFNMKGTDLPIKRIAEKLLALKGSNLTLRINLECEQRKEWIELIEKVDSKVFSSLCMPYIEDDENLAKNLKHILTVCGNKAPPMECGTTNEKFIMKRMQQMVEHEGVRCSIKLYPLKKHFDKNDSPQDDAKSFDSSRGGDKKSDRGSRRRYRSRSRSRDRSRSRSRSRDRNKSRLDKYNAYQVQPSEHSAAAQPGGAAQQVPVAPTRQVVKGMVLSSPATAAYRMPEGFIAFTNDTEVCFYHPHSSFVDPSQHPEITSKMVKTLQNTVVPTLSADEITNLINQQTGTYQQAIANQAFATASPASVMGMPAAASASSAPPAPAVLPAQSMFMWQQPVAGQSHGAAPVPSYYPRILFNPVFSGQSAASAAALVPVATQPALVPRN